MKKLYIKYYQVPDGRWQWQLCGMNHEAVATSGLYAVKTNMLKTIDMVKVAKVVEVKEGQPNAETIGDLKAKKPKR